MRLTDTCTIRNSGAYVATDTPCEFRHTGGSKIVELDRIGRDEQAVVIVGPLQAVLDVPGLAGFTVEHHGREYSVTAVLPRYITGGRLHHLSIELRRVTG